jgi:hypothetical protein
MADAPIEVWEAILRCNVIQCQEGPLDKTDLANLCLVSKTMRDVALGELWHTFEPRTQEVLMQMGNFSAGTISRPFASIKHLDIKEQSPRLNFNGLRLLLPRLQTLTTNGEVPSGLFDALQDTALQKVTFMYSSFKQIFNLPKSVKIVVKQTNSDNINMFFWNSVKSAAHHLKAVVCPTINPPDSPEFAEIRSKVTHLRMHSKTWGQGPKLSRPLAEHYPKVKSVGLSFFNLERPQDLEMYKEVVALPKLIQLEMWYCNPKLLLHGAPKVKRFEFRCFPVDGAPRVTNDREEKALLKILESIPERRYHYVEKANEPLSKRITDMANASRDGNFDMDYPWDKGIKSRWDL